MRDYKSYIEKLRSDAAEAELIRDLATVNAKREMFGQLARHLNQLANEVNQLANEVVRASFIPEPCTRRPRLQGHLPRQSRYCNREAI